MDKTTTKRMDVKEVIIMETTGTIGKMGTNSRVGLYKGKMATENGHSKGKKMERCDEIIPKLRWNKKKGKQEKSKKGSRAFICHCCKRI